MDFYDTVGGRRFIEGTVPKLIRAIERAAKAMERANQLKERELALAGAKPEPESTKLEDGEGYGSDDGQG
jgi:hypothetical protein